MRNIWRIFRDDARRLVANTMSIVVTVGLVVLPSLFAWYNVLACWDVFDNTGNLKVAVANSDAGYVSDLVPLPVNVGDQVVSALRANDQIDWVFTDEGDAVDGARAGRYYAAVVIPESFSRDMLTFFDADAERARIVYYSNEKKNAIAPKVTDQGADAISYEVNETFAETLSETALTIAESIARSADATDATGAIASIAAHMDAAADRLDETAALLDTYATLARSSQGLVAQSSSLVASAQERLDAAANAASGGAAAAGDVADGLLGGVDDLIASLDRAEQAFNDLASALEGMDLGNAGDVPAGPGADAGDAGDSGNAGGAGEGAGDPGGSDAGNAPADDETADGDPDASVSDVAAGGSGAPAAAAASAEDAALADALGQLRDDAVARAQAAAQRVADARASVERDVRAPLADVSAGAFDLESRIDGLSSTLAATAEELGEISAATQGVLESAQGGIEGATADVRASAERLRGLSADIAEALSSGDAEQVRAVLGADVQTLSRAIAAPVALDRTAIYPVANFGSAMTPLYATLALFIGSLLIMVAMKPVVPESELAHLDDPKPRELFLGRFGVVGALSLLQTTVMGLGCLLFLQVQAVHPVLFMVCFWAAGLVFSFIIYALVAAFANLGKAIAVLLLIVQVTGCGGSYPLAILPGFVQALSPYLPATHVVDAMRAAMMGVYGNDFWVSIGLLAAFAVPAAIIGLVLRRPLARFMHWFVEHAESSKLIG